MKTHNRWAYILVTALLFCIGVALWHHSSTLASHFPSHVVLDLPANGHSEPVNPAGELKKQAQEYCHWSLLNTVSGMEGHLPNDYHQRHIELVQVHLLVRHGDRSPATNVKLRPPVFYECGLVDKQEHWHLLNHIQRLPHPALSSSDKLKYRLFRGFSSKQCPIGQLTAVGFKQLRHIGLFMQSKYSKLLSSVTDPLTDIFIQSTNYERTIESAAAFMIGLLESQSELLQTVPIHVTRSIDLSHPPSQLPVVYPKCDQVRKIWQRELGNSHKLDNEVFKALSQMLDFRGMIEPNILFDGIWCRLCHNVSLPCGRNGCPDNLTILYAAQAVHKYFVGKYPMKLSIVKMQAYLVNTIIGAMDQAIRNIQLKLPSLKFTISFAHDSILQPLLNSLGLIQSQMLPYASRIAVELWRDKSVPMETGEGYYVRILVNGRPNTQGLPDMLMHYQSWRTAMVSGSVRDITAYQSVCGNS